MDEKIIAQNEQIKADPTDGMNKLDEMDLEMPEGLALSMAMNGKAMSNFCNMTVEQRKKIIDESRTVAEKEEMTQLIDRIASNSFQG